MSERVLRIASRRSALALWQANYIASRLHLLPTPVATELVLIETVGDRNQTDPLKQFGGTGVFTREVQKAVLEGQADVAVHSLKDLPTLSADGLILAAVPERAPRCDALLMPGGSHQLNNLSELPRSARIGTGSPRRRAQLLNLRPDLQIHEIRGNVDTRIRKLDEGQYDAIVLAEAGLIRLGFHNRISLRLQPPEFYPAVSQGALGLECREDDSECREILRHLDCSQTTFETIAERTLLRELRAGCHAPLGVWTEPHGDGMSLTAVILSTDGVTRTSAIVTSSTASLSAAENAGREAAAALLEQGAERLLNSIQA
jgi:hydroxymethylbilane synthase